MQPARLFLLSACLLALAMPVQGSAQGQQDPAMRLQAQRQAMQALSHLDGAWRGTFTLTLPDGKTRVMPHTERIGPLLDGSIKLIEGSSYTPDGKRPFNALGIVSFDPEGRKYQMRSYAQGHVTDVEFKLTADGFSWEMPAGPMTMRYLTTVRDGRWHEIGERLVPGQAPVRFIEMDLRRVGDSDWPVAGAVPAK